MLEVLFFREGTAVLGRGERIWLGGIFRRDDRDGKLIVISRPIILKGVFKL
jgi:hypothetical protein